MAAYIIVEAIQVKKNKTKKSTVTKRTSDCSGFILCGVSISGCVLDELDSVQFHHDISFCLELDYIVLSFSSGTGFLGVDVVQFWYQYITIEK